MLSLVAIAIGFITNTIQLKAFKWGTATASYQIEGAVNIDGRLPSIWDTFSAIPNKVHRNETGAIADDNYHRFLEDIQLMKDLNIAHYRLSFAWPRIIPDGKSVHQAGIDHYNKVIDALLHAGIEPFVTLYHWDLPQSVYDITNGGWINASIVPFFELYAKTVFDHFNDRVKYWLTFNEPWTFCVEGYDYGVHAPGRCTGCDPLGGNSGVEVYQCAHNVLLSHAAAVKYFRAQQYDQKGGHIGMTLNVDWAEPASSTQEDYDASQRRLIWECAWFADPIYFGDYPQVMKDYVGERLPTFTESEKRDLNGSHDFFGLNHYTTKWIVAQDNGAAPGNWATDQENSDAPCNQYNDTPIGIQADSNWLWVVPEGIYKVIKWIDARYGAPPIFITENGCDVPNEDALSLQNVLNDAFRIKYYDGYMTWMTKAKQEGSNIGGYYAWSLMDNFEWADGYSKRFGLHFVNYTDNNLTRTAKQSAKWFANYIHDWNPNAEYKGPTLSPTGIPTEYPDTVCPQQTHEDSKLSNEMVWIVCMVVVSSVICLAVCVVCVIKSRKMGQEILITDQDTSENESDDGNLMIKNADIKGNAGDMYKMIGADQ